MAKQKSTKKVSGYVERGELGAAILDFRRRLHENQREFAAYLGVSAGAVAQWETGKTKPSAMALMAIGKRVGADKAYWFKQAGHEYAFVEDAIDNYNRLHTVEGDENRVIHIYRSAGAGPNRFPVEQAEGKISLPRSWFKDGQRIVGLRAVDDSMVPLIHEGYLVLVDPNDNKDFKRLENQIVASRHDRGACIKWLTRAGEGYSLVSQNGNYAPIAVKDGDHAVIGRVVKWIGEPPVAKRK